MTHPLLERHIEGKAIKPLYLFFGEEEFLVERALRRLAQALAAATGEEPVRLVQDAGETDLKDFFAQARVATLWGPGQLLVLRRVDAYAAAELAPIKSYLEHPAPRTWVVLTAPGLKAKEVERHALWGRLHREGAALGFFRLREPELLTWLTQEARRLGKNLSPAAAQRLVEMVGDNLLDLTQELEKLALYAGEETTLTPQQVSRLASHSRAYNIFALVEALGEANAQRRLTALARLLELGEPPLRILVMLARQVRLLIRYLERPPGLSPKDLAQYLGLHQGLIKRLEQQARAFSIPALKAHLERLHRADAALKTGTTDARLWLEWVILGMGPTPASGASGRRPRAIL